MACGQWSVCHELRKEGKEETMEPGRQVGLELAEAIPEFHSRETALTDQFFPGNIGFMECWSGWIDGMSQERQPAAALYGLQE